MKRVLSLLLVASLLLTLYSVNDSQAYRSYDSSGTTLSNGLSANPAPVNQTVTEYLNILNRTSFVIAEKILVIDGFSVNITGNFAVLSFPQYDKKVVDGILSPYSETYRYVDTNFSFNPLLTYQPTAALYNGLPFVPYEIADAYDFNWAYNHGIYGNGTTIGIIDAYGDPSILYDVSVFDNLTHLPPIQLIIMGSTGNVNYSSLEIQNWSIETALDVEWAHAMAPGARILLIISPDPSAGLEAALSNAVVERLANVISISWGATESSIVNSGQMNTFAGIYQQAARNNITIVSASGDQGAYDGTSSLQVNYPASDPYVTAVGGTSLYYDNGYKQQAWGGTLDGASFGSGGGYSNHFGVPYWQNGAVQNAYRGVPDVAMVANPLTGAEAVALGTTFEVGGTSLPAPIFAAAVSLMDQFNNASLGAVNPLLYSIYGNSSLYSYAFTEVTSGSNGYYTASTGWNAVTGLGSPRVSNLLNVSKLIRSAYGSSIQFSGVDYNSSSVSSNLNLSISQGNETGNGSTYYYAGFGDSQGNYYRVGVDETQTGVKLLVTAMENGVNFLEYKKIGSAGSGTFSINASYSGFEFSGGVNSDTIANIFLFNTTGSMFPELGVEQLNSSNNLTSIPASVFYDISFGPAANFNGSQAYDILRYSPLGQSYSSITPVVNNSTVTFQSASTIVSTTSIDPTPKILYDVSTANPYAYQFYIPGSNTATNWYENGTAISDATTLSPGVYNITATVNSENISRQVAVSTLHCVNISLNDGYNYAALGYIALDYFYRIHASFTNSTEFSFLAPDLAAFLSLSFIGYMPQGIPLPETSTNLSLHMSPYRGTLNIFTSMANLNVSFGSKDLSYRYGYYSSSLVPGPYSVSINGTNIVNLTFNENLVPGTNYTLSVFPEPINGYHSLLGVVYDYFYNFTLGNVSVMSGEYMSYTDSSGSFYMILANGTQQVNFTRSLYQNLSMEVDENTSTQQPIAVKLKPANNYPSVLRLSDYFIQIDSVIPLLFYYYYVSWSLNYNNVAFYRILYSPTGNFSSSQYVDEPASDHSALIPVSFGSVSEYFTIMVFGTDGSFIGSTSFTHSTYVSPIPLLINGGIFFLIGVYVAFLVRFFRKGKGKTGKGFEEETGDNDKRSF